MASVTAIAGSYAYADRVGSRTIEEDTARKAERDRDRRARQGDAPQTPPDVQSAAAGGLSDPALLQSRLPSAVCATGLIAADDDPAITLTAITSLWKDASACSVTEGIVPIDIAEMGFPSVSPECVIGLLSRLTVVFRAPGTSASPFAAALRSCIPAGTVDPLPTTAPPRHHRNLTRCPTRPP